MVAFGLGALAYAGYFSYGYWLGTPTTAVVQHCEAGGWLRGLKQDWARGLDDDPGMYCDGTWSIRGQSQTGPIRPSFSGGDGDNYERPGSSLNVHVSGGTAYWKSKVLVLWIVGPVLAAWGSFNVWRRWRAPSRS